MKPTLGRKKLVFRKSTKEQVSIFRLCLCRTRPTHSFILPFLYTSIPLYSNRRCLWCNGYRRRKWTRWHEYKPWTRPIEFHIALIPLGKVWIQIFSLQLWVNSRADWFFRLGEETSLREGKLWIQTCKTPLQNWPSVIYCPSGGVGEYIYSNKSNNHRVWHVKHPTLLNIFLSNVEIYLPWDNDFSVQIIRSTYKWKHDQYYNK